MKNLKTLLVILCLFGCQEEIENTRLTQTSNDQVIIERFLASDSFNKLEIESSSLNFPKFYVNRDRQGVLTVILPFRANNLKYIFGYADLNRGEFSYSLVIEYETNRGYDATSLALRNGTYTGALSFTHASKRINRIFINNGSIDRKRTLSSGLVAGPEDEPAKENFCEDMKSYMTCAALKMEKMNWLEKGLCVVTIPECLAEQAAFCWVEGCQELNPKNFWPYS